MGDAWLRVVLHEPMRAGLADEVRALLPRAVDVRVERSESEGLHERSRSRRGRSAHDLFAEYAASEGIDDDRVLQLFARLFDDALVDAR